MKRWIMAAATLALAGCAAPQAKAPDEMERDLSAVKAAMLDYLGALSAEGRFIAGTQVNEYEVFLTCDSADRLVAMTGEEPALLGLELMFAGQYPPYEDYLVAHAVDHARRGGFVTMAWHHRNPLKVCPRGEFYDCTKTPMSAEELSRMLEPGTRENALWRADVATAAKTLKRLEDEGVVVLWRPYHEMHGGWFWWGQQEGFPQLWDALYHELTEVHGLTNLIWVWSAGGAAADAADYWPEASVPDATGSDLYEASGASDAFVQAASNIRALSDAPFAFTEVGKVPDADVMDAAKPAWVLVWGGEYLNADWAQASPCEQCNSAEAVTTFFAREDVVSLSEVPMELRRAVAGGEPDGAPQRPDCPSELIGSGE